MSQSTALKKLAAAAAEINKQIAGVSTSPRTSVSEREKAATVVQAACVDLFKAGPLTSLLGRSAAAKVAPLLAKPGTNWPDYRDALLTTMSVGKEEKHSVEASALLNVAYANFLARNVRRDTDLPITQYSDFLNMHTMLARVEGAVRV